MKNYEEYTMNDAQPPERIYCMDSLRDREDLQELARMGGQTACVANTRADADQGRWVRISDLKEDARMGYLTGGVKRVGEP